jgi:maltose alpha-D-glucosyltransferase/alpha-amylase
MELLNSLLKHWNKLYSNENDSLLRPFIKEVDHLKESIDLRPHQDEWFKDATVYSLYVDLFNRDFNGLEGKLDYLQGLGVNCLWLLPVLDSPMKDAGFDIRNYDQIRSELLGLPGDATVQEKQRRFRDFLSEAHRRDIKVIFDIAINHTSDEHPWFIESRKSTDNPYRNYYIWSDNTDKYKEARIIFEGLCESNWEKDGNWYFFHRFFEFQPDLNYRNPQVLIEMARNFLFWLTQGVDGFRADAIPYLWKEEGTPCENHPMTHTVVKFFRALIDYVRPGTLLLAEACQRPNEVVKYFGDGDECNAGYHFPLMPQIFKTLASEDKAPVENILSIEVTPVIPESAQWFTFMRCHDELSLELVYVSEEDRKYIHENYCLKPEWDFRLGQGVSARLAELLKRDPQKIGLAYSIMLSLPGTPIIYYGDEFGKLNDHAYYQEMIKLSGKDDTRFLVRGKIDWNSVDHDLQDDRSFAFQVYNRVKALLNARKKYKSFGRGSIEWLRLRDDQGNDLTGVLAYYRSHDKEKLLILQNLKKKEVCVGIGMEIQHTRDVTGQDIILNQSSGEICLKPLQYLWIDIAS